MPKLIENVLIGGRVRLAGEDISEADARGIRPEVFTPGSAGASAQEQDEPAQETEEQPAKPQRRRPSKKSE